MIVPPDPQHDPVAAEQARQNRTTERQWAMYASHRRRVERLIVPERPGGSIAVLGAGNCNDLDLAWMTEVYAEVHLVDLDADALRSGLERQRLGPRSDKVRLHAPVDLTAIADHVAGWSRVAPTVADVDRGTKMLLQPPTTPWGPCDVVLSPCVLTQTITPSRDALREVFPASHPSVRALRAGLRTRHLRTMAASLKPGGRGVLVVDLVSSEKVADLARIPEAELPAAMDRLVSASRHFRDVDPTAITSTLRGDAELAKAVTSVRVEPPWLWHLGLRKSFLVYAVTFRRGAGYQPMSAPAKEGITGW